MTPTTRVLVPAILARTPEFVTLLNAIEPTVAVRLIALISARFEAYERDIIGMRTQLAGVDERIGDLERLVFAALTEGEN